jgi:16S rRNA (adenine1518-N6/adenine1519-N6)-dimethyltransferase
MRAKKKYGQHFLQGVWADKLVAAIDPHPGDRFLEIGPGPGALTLRLAPRVRHLTAVELDREMIDALAPQIPDNVTLVEADFLEYDLGAVIGGGRIRVAGNLPYNVSSPILFRLIDTHRTSGGIVDATVMVQLEVAERIAAKPGSKAYGVLSILIQLHADVVPLLTLPPGAFRPAPNVRSAVIRLRFRPPAIDLADEPEFVAMVRSMFTKRRKTLRNALRAYAEGRGAGTADALLSAGVDPARRAETLQLPELSRLADFFASRPRRAVL